MSQFYASGGQSNWNFNFSISPSNEYSELISFRMDRLDILAVQVFYLDTVFFFFLLYKFTYLCVLFAYRFKVQKNFH